MKKSNMTKLNLGCGIQIRKGFINVDKFYTEEELRGKKGFFKNADIQPGGKYVQADILNLPFEENSADYVEMMNTIEHFPMRKVVDYLKEVYRVMKPKAKLIIMTNHFSGLAVEWLEMVVHPPLDINRYVSIAETIYGNQQAGGETHMCPFTPEFMDHVLTQAGFKEGMVAIIPKGTLISSLPKPITQATKWEKNAICRNDLLYVEAIK